MEQPKKSLKPSYTDSEESSSGDISETEYSLQDDDRSMVKY